MGYVVAFILGFLAGAAMTRRVFWKIVEGKAKLTVTPAPKEQETEAK